MALYFERRINTPSDCFFGNFVHWDYYFSSQITRIGLISYPTHVELTMAGIETTTFIAKAIS